MNVLSQIAIDLKTKGYNQQITIGDYIYVPSTDTYVRILAEYEPPSDYVRVPPAVNLMNAVSDLNYKLLHQRIDSKTEKWVLNYENKSWEDDNIWVVLSKFWMDKKGK